MSNKVRIVQSRLWNFDELPEKEQSFNDWADEDTQFVRYVYPSGEEEFIPLENFQAVSSPLPSGLMADELATDSYFSGTALRWLENKEPLKEDDTREIVECDGDPDVELWLECW